MLIALQEQVEWAVEEGADFIVAETFGELSEAKLALECIKSVKKGKLFALPYIHTILLYTNWYNEAELAKLYECMFFFRPSCGRHSRSEQ